MFHRHCRRSQGEARAVRHNAKAPGDVITMDDLSSDGDVGMSLSGNVTALIARDATGWLDAYPAGSKCTEEVSHALQHFMSPTDKVGLVATDDALEYERACKQLGYRHRTSTPGRPQTNGIAERSVREAVAGARTMMQKSRLSAPMVVESTATLLFLAQRHEASERGVFNI